MHISKKNLLFNKGYEIDGIEWMKKVLIISYYWPPAGGISVLRTLKIAKHLRSFGWEPIIYTASNPSYPYLDKDNFKDIPDGVEIIKKPIIEPFDIFKKLSGRKKNERLDNILQVRSKNSNIFESIGIWIRANFFIPDARCLWIWPSVRHLKKYIQNNNVDAIFSDGPPHTNTVIANKLSQFFNIPWLADFQDPWTQADYYEMFPIGKLAHSIHRRMEKRVFQDADKITIASPSWKIDLQGIGAKDVDVIYYGFDNDDFLNIAPKKDVNKILITHAGLLGIDRFPESFFIALRTLINDNAEIAKKIEVKLIGQVDWSIKDKVQEMGLGMLFTFIDFIPRKEVLKMNANADLLLLPLNRASNAKGRLPGKIYEYLKSGTPVAAFGPQDSDASTILRETKCGITISYDDIETNLNILRALIHKKTFPNFAPNPAKIEEFSNFNQTKKVAYFLESISKKQFNDIN